VKVKIAVAVGILLAAAAISDGITMLNARSKKKSEVVASASPGLRKVASSKARYPFEEIERHLVENKGAIASCFWTSAESMVGRYRLEMFFNSSSKIRKVSVVPVASKESEVCIENLVSTWALPPSTTSRPFTFQAHVSL
jgi:hypothetical protein